MENLSESYYKKLESSDKPGVTLAEFYCSLYKKEVTRSEIIMCNRLVGMFGRFLVYYAIMSMFSTKPDGAEEPQTYLFAICQRRFEAMHEGDRAESRRSLSTYISNMREEIENLSKQKVKIPSSKGLEKSG